jgi:hypothetical protein
VKRNVLIGVVAAIAFIALLAYMTMGMKQHRVNVCMEFMGRTNCATAAGPTREQALRTASETACATISSGMTESVTCGRTPPVKVNWLD